MNARREITFTVSGIPQPRGSKRAMPNRAGGRPLMMDTNPKSKPWMAAVASAAAEAMKGWPLLVGPVEVEVNCYMPRPKSHYRTGKHAGEKRDDAPAWCDKKPDADKIARGIHDAMTGVVYRDDAQVSALVLRKIYSDQSAAANVRVAELTTPQEPTP